jgi:hypothetical protein
LYRKAGLKEGTEMEYKELRKAWKDEYMLDLLPGKSLHPWQQLGVTFLHQCSEKYGFALLGDEMGVGKVSFFINFIDL